MLWGFTIPGIAISLIILFYLIRINKNLSRYTPLIIYVVLSVFQLVIFSILKINPKEYSHLLYISEPLAMVYGVLIYIYARKQSSPNLKLYKTDWFLLIPFALAIVSYLPFYTLSAAEKLSDLTKFGSLNYDVFENVWEWNFEIIFNSTLMIAALKELKKYNTNIKDQFSDIHKIDLHLTQLVIKVCLATYLLELIFVYLTFFGFPYYRVLFEIFYLLDFTILLIIGYDAIVSYKHIEILQKGWADIPESEIKLSGQIVKYAKSTLSKDSSLQIKEDLLEYMSTHKPFLKPKLKIKDLTELTGISSHHISQVVNEEFQKNFYEFINYYRVEEAKKLLKDPDYKNFTYTAIGFEVGFNSKSTFYTAFKKLTGVTPAQF